MPMPPEASYRELLAALKQANRTIDASADDLDGRKARLHAGINALRHLILFLLKDAEVKEGGLARPIALIENAIHDAGQGAAPTILALLPEGRKPTATMHATERSA